MCSSYTRESHMPIVMYWGDQCSDERYEMWYSYVVYPDPNPPEYMAVLSTT